MPNIDMPLKDLQQYQGTNPIPNDFDDYWSKALEEMHSIDPQVQIERAEVQFPNAECFHLYFTGVRGARIYAKYLRPTVPANTPTPAVVLFHGYSGSSGDWWDKLAFVNAGFSVFAMDCRGQAGFSQDTGGVNGTTLQGHIIRGLDDKPENLLFRHIFLDAAQLAGIAMDMDCIDETRVMAYGGSQGGALTVVCAALETRIFKAAALHPFLSDYKRVWEMDFVEQAYAELAYYFRKIDPLHQHEEEVFTRLGYIDVQHLAKRIKSQILMGVTLRDVTCPPSSQFAIYNKIQSQKELLVYSDYAHEVPPGFMDKVLSFFTSELV